MPVTHESGAPTIEALVSEWKASTRQLAERIVATCLPRRRATAISDALQLVVVVLVLAVEGQSVSLDVGGKRMGTTT